MITLIILIIVSLSMLRKIVAKSILIWHNAALFTSYSKPPTSNPLPTHPTVEKVLRSEDAGSL